MPKRDVGSWVWLPHEDDLFVPAKVTASKDDGSLSAQSEDGEVR